MSRKGVIVGIVGCLGFMVVGTASAFGLTAVGAGGFAYFALARPASAPSPDLAVMARAMPVETTASPSVNADVTAPAEGTAAPEPVAVEPAADVKAAPVETKTEAKPVVAETAAPLADAGRLNRAKDSEP